MTLITLGLGIAFFKFQMPTGKRKR
jgi:hypothetical protein